MTIKEMLNRVIEILTDKHTTRFYVELPKINTEALRKRIIDVLNNKRGEFGGGNIPDDEIEALADIFLPGVIKFFSTDNQREESIEGQLRECQAFAKKNDITLLEPYIDRALSAKTDNRPNFQKMIKDSAAKKFDVVIVWKLDRFARNRYDSAHYNVSR